KLLLESNLSLKEISQQLHFGSEHYLNAFFKKYAGMPPGAYRKMQGK
ncbi:MAG: helix-turn-helix domain-containing protein, partial [Oscillospiraceae bacterium]|nr:helix-turn-helix domain-containing protein [Oscillospiraceae bacterium]